MNLKEKYIEKFIEEQIPVDVYTDVYDESIFGFVMKSSEELLLIECFNKDIRANGIAIVLKENISRFRWNGNEGTSSIVLMTGQERLKDLETLDISSILAALNSVGQRFGHVTLYIQDIDKDVCFIGEIEEMDEETIVLKTFGTMSTLDRDNILLEISDITKIEAGGIYENNLMKLYINKKVDVSS